MELQPLQVGFATPVIRLYSAIYKGPVTLITPFITRFGAPKRKWETSLLSCEWIEWIPQSIPKIKYREKHGSIDLPRNKILKGSVQGGPQAVISGVTGPLQVVCDEAIYRSYNSIILHV